MKKYNKLIVSVYILLLILIMSITALGETVFRFSTDNQMDSPIAQGGYKLAELLKERTNGELQVEVYHSGQLGDDRDIAESIQLGGDMIYAGGSGVLTAWIPELKVLDLPFIFRSTSHVESVLNGEIGRRLNKYYEEKGFKLLSYMDGGFRDFSNSKRAIYSMEDLKGLKVRLMQTPYYIEAMKEFGAEVIVMPYSELFVALKQGIVDGQENNATLTYTDQMHTLGQKFWSPIHYAYCAVPLIMNLGRYNDLTPEQQEIIVQSAQDASIYAFEYYRKVENDYTEKLREAGVKVPNREEIDLTGFYEASERVWKKVEGEIDIDLAYEIQNYGLNPVVSN